MLKRRKKLIYVAGILSNGGKNSRSKQIYYMFKAIKSGIKLMTEGYDIYIPHLSVLVDIVSRKKFGYDQWIELDQNLLGRFDGIYLMKNWQQSSGSAEEYFIAKYLELEILFEDKYDYFLEENVGWDKLVKVPKYFNDGKKGNPGDAGEGIKSLH